MPYDSVARYPEKYMTKLMSITGEVMQSEDDMLLVHTKKINYGYIGDKYMDDLVYVAINPDTIQDGRVLNEDIITVYGVCTGVTRYPTINGGANTIPSLTASEIVNKSAQ